MAGRDARLTEENKWLQGRRPSEANKWLQGRHRVYNRGLPRSLTLRAQSGSYA